MSCMVLREILDEKEWNGFVAQQSWTSFLQSWQWGEFQRTQGHEVKRFMGVESTGVSMACQLIRYNRKWGMCYWFAPRGPIFSDEAKPRARELLRFFFAEVLKSSVLSGKPLFIRIEPSLIGREGEGAMPLRCRRNHSMSPASTIRLDLRQGEEELLAAMHSKTRYNIRVAERHGVLVREATSDQDLEHFLRLTKETATRDGIRAHGDVYLRATYQFLRNQGIARLRVAEFEGKILVANMEMAFGDTFTYLHGASSSESRNVMAPVLLQWEAIKTAKAEGYHWYDMYGANPLSKTSYYYKSSWEGISRFKQGFGGEQIDFIGTWDLPLNRLLYKFAFPESFLRG